VTEMVAVALTIAGVDPSGGAGIAADLKTFHQHRVYGCAVVSLLTVQNTTALRRVEVLPPSLVSEQLDAVLEDITPAAAKTGALGSAAMVDAVAGRLRDAHLPLVVDPVRVAKHGAALLDEDARRALLDHLMPLATVLTANAPEAAWLAELPVRNEDEALAAAQRLCQLGARAVLVKGGHLEGAEAVDLLLAGGEVHRLCAPRLVARHTHGVGCTLSAAITANLALGLPLLLACERAKRWLTSAIASAPGVGRGIGAVDHLAVLVEDADGAAALPGDDSDRR
jgi:hydroxymethylpyrimidine/phosphomethylpyrimidine kinase